MHLYIHLLCLQAPTITWSINTCSDRAQIQHHCMSADPHGAMSLTLVLNMDTLFSTRHSTLNTSENQTKQSSHFLLQLFVSRKWISETLLVFSDLKDHLPVGKIMNFYYPVWWLSRWQQHSGQSLTDGSPHPVLDEVFRYFIFVLK